MLITGNPVNTNENEQSLNQQGQKKTKKIRQ